MMQLLDPSTQWLEIPATVHQTAWQQENLMAGDRVQAYLNQVCLQTVLPWLQEKSGIEPIADNHPEVWSLVNGCAINIGNTRLILLPTEAMDKSEFRVPQEWVDLPTWIGDYYLAVEVDTDEQWLNLWGYTTHQALKSIGAYDEHDRTYSLEESDVIQDLTVFWVMQQLAAEVTRADIPTLLPLTAIQAESLIQRLSSLDIILPRLEVSFAKWGALLESPTWFQQFCDRRRTRTNAPVSANLSQWMQNVFETGWQAIEELFQAEPTLAFSFRREDEPEFTIRRAKRLQVGADINVLLVVRLDTEMDQRRRIWLQVLPWQCNALPENLSVELLSATGAVLQSVQAGSQSNYVQLKRFKCAVGTPFRLQIVCADTRIVEEFIA